VRNQTDTILNFNYHQSISESTRHLKSERNGSKIDSQATRNKSDLPKNAEAAGNLETTSTSPVEKLAQKISDSKMVSENAVMTSDPVKKEIELSETLQNVKSHLYTEITIRSTGNLHSPKSNITRNQKQMRAWSPLLL
jgi:hypothetical protein